jgi:hypothetical protein
VSELQAVAGHHAVPLSACETASMQLTICIANNGIQEGTSCLCCPPQLMDWYSTSYATNTWSLLECCLLQGDGSLLVWDAATGKQEADKRVTRKVGRGVTAGDLDIWVIGCHLAT